MAGTTIRAIRDGKPCQLVQARSRTGRVLCVQCSRRIPKSYLESWKGKHGLFCTDACAIKWALWSAAQVWVKEPDGARAAAALAGGAP